MDSREHGVPSTASGRYTSRLVRLESVWWKRLLNVQAPYNWNLRRVVRGPVLDVGCGIGRHLGLLPKGSMGVDHNPESVRVCVDRGLTACLASELVSAPETFGTLLFSHVVEHMTFDSAVALVAEYLRYLRPGGRVLLITPQRKGFASDATHVEYFDLAKLRRLADRLKLTTTRQYSFPLPAAFGACFTHNEFHSVAEK
jgi:SAM-dependent methyltransferase